MTTTKKSPHRQIKYVKIDPKAHSAYQHFSVEVAMPYFVIGKTNLTVESFWQKATNEHTPYSYALPSSLQAEAQHYVTPTSIDQITNEHGQVIKMRYQYHNVPVNLNHSSSTLYQAVTINYLTRVKIAMPDYDYVIPSGENIVTPTEKTPKTANPSQPGWLYASATQLL